MKRILTLLFLTLALTLPAFATDIVVSSATIPNWIGPTSGVELRGFLTGTMTVPEGSALSFTASASTNLLTIPGHSLTVGGSVYVNAGAGAVLPAPLAEGTRYFVISVAGNDVGISTTSGGAAVDLTSNGSGTLYVRTSTKTYPASSPKTGVTAWRWTCTVSSSVVGGLTIYTLTIPSITIPATTDAVSGYGSRWEFYFYRSTGVQIGPWNGFANLAVPTAPTSSSWDAIKIYNNNTIPVADASTYTKSEINALLLACCAGGGAGGYSRIQEEGVDLTQRTTLNFVGAGFTAADDSTRTTVTLDADLNALAGLSTTGLVARTGTTTYATRSISGRTDQIDVTNGDGVSGNLSLKIPDYLELGKDGLGGILGLRQAGSTSVVQFQASTTTMLGSYVYTLPNALPASASCLQISSTGVWSYTTCGGGGGGAPTNAQYITAAFDGTLSDERVIAGGRGIVITDQGANDYLGVAIDETNAFQPTWLGRAIYKVGSSTASAEALRIDKDNRVTNGVTVSDYISIYGKERTSSVNYNSEWRLLVNPLISSTGQSYFELRTRVNGGTIYTPFAVSQAGDIVATASLTLGSLAKIVADSSGYLQPSAFANADLSGAGTAYKLVTTTGTLTSGRCAEWDANGNLVQSAGACASTAAAAGSTGDYQINSGGSLAAGQLKDLAGGAVSFTNGASGGTFRAIPDSPATITSNQNNLTITGRSLNLRLATDAQRTMRGLTFSGNPQVDGEWHIIQNVGTQPIDFTHEDSSATAANRFRTASNRTVTLLADRAALAVYDNTTARHRLYPLAVNAPETLHTNTAFKSVTNTVTETSLLNNTFSVPANFFTVGKTLHVVVSGIISTAVSAPTFRIRLKSGVNVIADSTAITMTSLGGTSRAFTAEIMVICESVGASGAFDGVGQFRYNTAANGLSSLEIPTGPSPTLDTTGALTFDLTAQWGTANVQNSITVFSAHVTAYN